MAFGRDNKPNLISTNGVPMRQSVSDYNHFRSFLSLHRRVSAKQRKKEWEWAPLAVCKFSWKINICGSGLLDGLRLSLSSIEEFFLINFEWKMACVWLSTWTEKKNGINKIMQFIRRQSSILLAKEQQNGRKFRSKKERTHYQYCSRSVNIFLNYKQED